MMHCCKGILKPVYWLRATGMQHVVPTASTLLQWLAVWELEMSCHLHEDAGRHVAVRAALLEARQQHRTQRAER